LLRVKRLEAEIRQQQGMELDEDTEDMLPGVDKVWLAKELERDAKEKAQRERERMKEEGGAWHGVDLEAGVELSAEDVTAETQDAKADHSNDESQAHKSGLVEIYENALTEPYPTDEAAA